MYWKKILLNITIKYAAYCIVLLFVEDQAMLFLSQSIAVTKIFHHFISIYHYIAFLLHLWAMEV